MKKLYISFLLFLLVASCKERKSIDFNVEDYSTEVNNFHVEGEFNNGQAWQISNDAENDKCYKYIIYDGTGIAEEHKILDYQKAIFLSNQLIKQ